MKAKIPMTLAAMAFSGMLFAAGAQTGAEGQPGAELETDRPTAGVVEPREGMTETPGVAETPGVEPGLERDRLDIAHQELFDAIDEDGDGHISREELLSWFEEHDQAGDGRLSQAEFAQFLEAQEAMIDRDPAVGETPGVTPGIEDRPGEDPALPGARPPTGPGVATPPGEGTN